MKIAIASCFNPINYPNQPVWDHVSAHSPDVLVLLGDSIYLDIPWVTTFADTVHPSDATAADFLRHGLKLYRTQLNEKHFARLVGSVPKTFAIWDDHDFLWNGAAGDSLSQTLYRDHIQASRALFKAYRNALTNRNPASFPTTDADPQLKNPNEPAPGYQMIDLNANICLHLTDGRSFRNKHHLLGSAQRGQISNAMQSRRGNIHILASGIVFNGNKGERWAGYGEDYEWLKRLALEHKILVISGDVHENRIPAPFKIPGGHDILEITSSGAAIGALVALGAQKHNFGLIEIANGHVTLSAYRDIPVALDKGPVTISINNW